jgi:hypothetical protein
MTTEKSIYLTETILSIHNEVQSALDYISTIAAEKGTDLGKSTALLSIQNLRVKVPIKFNLEITEHPAETDLNTSVTKIGVTDLLRVRRGLVLQTAEFNEPVVLASKTEFNEPIVLASKIGVTLASTENKTADSTGSNVEHKQEAWGEIEITFTPLKRE